MLLGWCSQALLLPPPPPPPLLLLLLIGSWPRRDGLSFEKFRSFCNNLVQNKVNNKLKGPKRPSLIWNRVKVTGILQ
jgi:hypothetical protein